MKIYIPVFLSLALGLSVTTSAQNNLSPGVVLSAETGSRSADLQSILYFEGINMEKFMIRGTELSGRDFQLNVKEFVEGRLVKTDTIFNSHEDAYFRLKADSLPFRAISKITESGVFKIRFQFNGFAVNREYQLSATEKNKFTLKDFLSQKKEMSIDFAKGNYLLAFMPPYIRPNKSEAYCEVAQSGTDPEKLFDKYGLRHYYLFEISFL